MKQTFSIQIPKMILGGGGMIMCSRGVDGGIWRMEVPSPPSFFHKLFTLANNRRIFQIPNEDITINIHFHELSWKILNCGGYGGYGGYVEIKL